MQRNVCYQNDIFRMFFFFFVNALLQINSFRGYFFIEIILQSTIDNNEIVYYATEAISSNLSNKNKNTSACALKLFPLTLILLLFSQNQSIIQSRSSLENHTTLLSLYWIH